MSKHKTDLERLYFNKEFSDHIDNELYKTLGATCDGKPVMKIMASLASLLADVMAETFEEPDGCIFSETVGNFIHDSFHALYHHKKREEEKSKNLS